jgi:hypothetical protein
MREPDITCRLCGTHDEHILELGGCPCIIKILRQLLRLADHRSYTFTDILLAFPDEKKQGLRNMLIIASTFIIRHFYLVEEQSTAYTDHATITKLTLAKFAQLALGFSQKIKRRIFFNSCSGTNTLDITKCSRTIVPFASLSPTGDLQYPRFTLKLLNKYGLQRYIPNSRPSRNHPSPSLNSGGHP